MPLQKDQAAAGAAIVEALANAPSGMRRAAIQTIAKKEDAASFDAECADLYEDAALVMPRTIAELEDPRRYAAWCIRSMKHDRKTRSKLLMVQHLGKVFGHDKRTIEVKDKNTIRDAIRELRLELGVTQTVDGQVVVKEIGDGKAQGR